ncbi:hypothetical protein DAPPUDRAFT_321573 [Daphnia pulex]|uniref:Uncharacterized protein n=1 Tax=Daphnia pulex TaxID=6669 RepID=E9GT22_DAPPU|nr:hypothetical protein DAPPUDRAFT_321573 [Daphnia pulex]|eukprot:EFX77295.1 hypothetical protein DAPPUDRAFT_321573 [Daphnia pulex]
MENDEEVENVDNEYLLHSNDESLLSNDTQLLIMNNETSLNNEDSLQTPDALPSCPDNRIKHKRKLEESQAEKDMSMLVSQLINEKPNHVIEKKEELGEVTKEWRNYNNFFADKVAKIKSKSIKDDVRFQMEQLLYETGKKEKEKSKIRKKKEENWLNKA